jgi:hypothetical protein
MLAERWIHVTTYVVLGVIAGVLGVALIASLIAEWRGRQAQCGLSDKSTLRVTENSAPEITERRSAPRV